MTLPEMNAAIDLLIERPRDDDAGRYALVAAVARATLILPTRTDPSAEPSSFAPLMVSTPEGPHIVVCNSTTAADAVRAEAPFGLTMKGADIIARASPRVGLLLLSDSGRMGLAPQMVAAMRADILQGRL